MARKKKYKGKVINEFSVGHADGTKHYKIGDTFETTNKGSLEHLINIQKIQK